MIELLGTVLAFVLIVIMMIAVLVKALELAFKIPVLIFAFITGRLTFLETQKELIRLVRGR